VDKAMLKNSMPQRDRETAATSPNITLTGFIENVVTDLLPNQQCQHCLMTTDYRKTVVLGQCATKNVPNEQNLHPPISDVAQQFWLHPMSALK